MRSAVGVGPDIRIVFLGLVLVPAAFPDASAEQRSVEPASAGGHSAAASGRSTSPAPEGESYFFTPSGFAAEGKVAFASGSGSGRLRIVVRDRTTGQLTPCRIAVVGPDGDFYQPHENRLKKFSLSGEWPTTSSALPLKEGEWGNRRDKAPYRYLGRFFYSTGDVTVDVPAGTTRVEVAKGFEFRPQRTTATVAEGQTQDIELRLERAAPMSAEGYFGGDPHLHFARTGDADDDIIFDLLDAEDIQFGTPLGANIPAGPYTGSMDAMAFPQFRGLGADSVRTRGGVSILSGQEYRSGVYGHLNLYLRDRLVLAHQSLDADDWPVFGLLGAETRAQGGVAIHAHGGYEQEIYADAALDTVDAVELLQFGVYREIGLAGWYAMLNSGYRFPCVGGSDYPACRFLGDCRTYVWDDALADGDTAATERPTFPDWLRGAAEGRSFVTTGPLLLLEVDGKQPGETIRHDGGEPWTVTARARVRCEVTPVTNVDLIVNGETVKRFDIAGSPAQDGWHVIEHRMPLREACWIAARAWSTTPGGRPDAESHTNPVYVYVDGKSPYRRDAIDAWIEKIDVQIAVHTARDFPHKAQTLAYFQRARDLLLEIRQRGGLNADERPADVATEAVGGAADFRPDDLAADASRHDPTDEELREFLKPVPPLTPEQALQTFETAPGFHLELVAAEPLVRDPVAAAFDEDGNLYVCEMRDYPFKPAEGDEPLGGVRLLRDTDGDGRFDESHAFAGKLLWAAGVAPWKGGVFVSAPPDIWYLKDTDGDFRADLRRRVFSGFGTDDQQAMLNNLQFGLDLKIYGATAGNGGRVRPADDSDGAPVSVDGRDFRFDPATLRFEAVTGTVQFGNTFDDFGNRFVCSESRPLMHVVLPDHYLARNPFLPAPDGIQDVAPGPVPVFRISPVERWRQIRSSRRIAKGERSASASGASHHVVDAAAGVTVYRGGAYPPEFYGDTFVGDGQNNLVHRRVLSPDGVTFRSLRGDDKTEFVRSSDIWFRPVNFMNAPDGTLYCLDMCREVLESTHIPLDVVKHLDLTSGRDHGRIYRIAPDGFRSPAPPRLRGASGRELVAALESPHGWFRDTAHRLIYERQDRSIAPALHEVSVRSRLPQARVLALWSMEGLQALDRETLVAALDDPHSGVRENAVRLAEPRLASDPELLQKVLFLASDEAPRVRFQVAFSLGEANDLDVVPALARVARRDGGDLWTRVAVMSSAAESSDELFVELLGEGLAADRPPDTLFAKSETGVLTLGQLAHVVGLRCGQDEVDRVLDAVAGSPFSDDPAVYGPVLVELGRGLTRAGGRLAHGDSGSETSRWLTLRLSEALRAAADAGADERARVTAIELAGCAHSPETRRTMMDLIRPGQSDAVQAAAVRALAADGDPEVTSELIARLSRLTPAVRRVAIEVLLTGEQRTLALLEALSRGDASSTEIEPAVRDRLLTHGSESIRALANRALGGAIARDRDPIIAEYQASLKLRGDSKRGRVVFERNCATCHRLEDRGFPVGPNLASSPTRDAQALLTHILDPNRTVLPDYVQYVVVDRQGRVFTGMLSSQTSTSLTLKKGNDETVTVLRNDVEELQSGGKSLMPEGFEKTIGPQDMADLIAYLQESTAGRASEAPNAERDLGTLPGRKEPKRNPLRTGNGTAD